MFATILTAFTLTACTNQQQTAKEIQPSDSTTSDKVQYAVLRSPADSLEYGRKSATYRHLAKLWQVKAVNDTPITQMVILDLTHIMQGDGTLTLYPDSNHMDINIKCIPIDIQFDVSDISTNILHTKQIERSISPCSDEFEDKMINILADINHVKYAKDFYQDNSDPNITLITYQDKILLAPITP